ncbi:hypothetical protein HY388_02695 [Candidatus Daviesbacteria bacterium]|nr:hypothetical protein [Candidatus Daviesbacteria bacterium]
MNSLHKVLTSWYFPFILIGIALKLALAAITSHTDLFGLSLSAHQLSNGVVNIYDFMASLNPDHPIAANIGTTEVFIYPPLAYFALGAFMFVLNPFYDPSFFDTAARLVTAAAGDPGLFRYLLLFKLPYLAFDLAMAWLLVKLLESDKEKKIGFLFWLFNPVVVYATYMIGSFDIIPTFLVVLAIYLAQKHQALATVMLGLGAGFKTFPLLVLLPMVAVIQATWKKRLVLILAGILPFVFVVLPYWNSWAFKNFVLFNPKSQKFLFSQLLVSGGEALYPFVVVLVLITIFAVLNLAGKTKELWAVVLAVILSLLSLTHYHPQWLVWAVPFLTILFAKHDWSRGLVVTLFICWLVQVLLFDPTLSIRLFAPLNPALLQSPGLSDILATKFDLFQLKSLAQSVFAAVSFFIIIKLFGDISKR